MASTSYRCARTVSEALVWYHFLPLHSAAGRRWYDDFESSGAERIVQNLDRVVARMRRGEHLDAASGELDKIYGSILTLGRSAPTSICAVMEEAYRGVLGYWHFRKGSLEAADSELLLALLAVHETLHSEASLLPFSLKKIQLTTNRARVARRLGDWIRMKRHLDTCDRMLANREPLHGRGAASIYFRDVSAFYQVVEPVDGLDAEALNILTAPESLAVGFRQAIYAVWSSLNIANDY